MKYISQKILLLISLMLVSMAPAQENHEGADLGQRMFSVIPLRSVTFEEAQQVIEPFLSEEGRVFNLKSRESLVVFDLKENVKVIKQVLSEIDAPPVNIRVSVTFDEASSGSSAEIGATLGGITIRRTERGRTLVSGSADITAGAGRTESSDIATQFILTREGRPASIWVGETVAEPVWIFEYGRRHGWWRKELVWQEIGASLWVLPRLIGGSTIALEVYPRLTVRGDTPLTLDVKDVSTQVIVEDGQTVSLAGMDREQQEFYARLFGIGRIFNGRRLAITLRADIVSPAGR